MVVEEKNETNFDYDTFFSKLNFVERIEEADPNCKYSVFYTFITTFNKFGKEFSVPKQYQFKHFDNYEPLNYDKIKKICEECGNEFFVTKKTLINGGGIYCEKCRIGSGEDAPNWKGGISFEPYCPKFNNTIKDRVRNHFNNKCIICGKSNIDNKRELHVHHVNYDKGQGCSGEWLLVPLCTSCHIKTNTDRDIWESYFTNYLAQFNFNCGVE